MLLDQLIYTRFPESGFQLLTSPQIPMEVQDAFLQSIIHPHWHASDPFPPDFRAAYLHQIAPAQTLFGWVYNQSREGSGPNNTPHFLCYGINETLNCEWLDIILDCLERGPIAPAEWQSTSHSLAPIPFPENGDYRPIHFGVTIPSSLRLHNHLLLEQQNLLSFFTLGALTKNTQEVADQPEPMDTSHLAVIPPSLAITGLSPKMFVNSLGSQVGPASETITDRPIEKLVKSLEICSQAALATQKQPRLKVALLIGVSAYGVGFEPLPGSIKDVEEMKQVLEHPDLGGFSRVHTLLNPTPQTMAEAIETLFEDCSPNDLVLFYFSGHAIRDNQGQVYLTTGSSRRGKRHKVVRSTIVPARFLSEMMDEHPGLPTVVILDCWVSEAVPQAESSLGVDLNPQLGGARRTILTSCLSTQQAFTHKGENLSLYTKHLVEGVQTGAADLNSDGLVSVLEWHRYARQRVRQTAPALRPKIYGVQSANDIFLAQSPIEDAMFKYRRQVEKCSSHGDISIVDRVALETWQTNLRLDSEVAALIESEVLKPHEEYKVKLREYAVALMEAIQQEYPVSDATHIHLQELQGTLGLTDADLEPLEATLMQQIPYLQLSKLELVSSTLTRDRNNGQGKAGRNRSCPAKVFMAVQSAVQHGVASVWNIGSQLSYGFCTTLMNPWGVTPKTDLESRSALTPRKSLWVVGAGTFTVLSLIVATQLWQYAKHLEQDVQKLERTKMFTAKH